MNGDWLTVEGVGIIAIHRIVAVAPTSSAPIKRLIHNLPTSQLIVLTNGRKRQTAVCLDSGHLILTPLPLNEIISRLQ